MNKTFKVVFNKARGVMTVVNETTSSVQAKGCKAAIAATVLSLAVGSAFAADPTLGAGAYFDGKTFIYAEGAQEAFETAEVTEEGIKVVVDGYQSTGNLGALINLGTNNKQSEVHIVAGSSFTNNKISGNDWHDGAALSIWQQGTLGESAPNHTITGTTFTNNVVEGTNSGKGGAIAFLSNSEISKEGSTTISNSTFTGNKNNSANESAGGGAIFIEGTTVNIVDGTTFSENESKKNGGAIAVGSTESDLAVDGASFFSNKAGKNGGAIMLWSDGKVGGDQKFTIKNSTFDGNIADEKGGAIAWLVMDKLKDGQQVIITDTKFTENKAKTGGAIRAEGSLTVEGSSLLDGNEASLQGGAIYVSGEKGQGGELIISSGTEESHVVFSNNKVTGESANSHGGAIFNSGLIHIGDYTTFSGNSATVGGGAISNASTDDNIIGSNVTFNNNTAASGGAIFNQRATMEIKESAQFVGNSANGGESTSGYFGVGGSDNGSGGAIMNQANGWDSTMYKAHLTIGSGAEFTQNTATNNGGAVSNYAWTDTEGNEPDYSNGNIENVSITFNGDASFTENTAGNLGGAIYNDGTINFNGNATFSANKANGKLNDIHNEGIVKVNKGTLTLDGGITGDGDLIFADGTGLSVKVGTSQADSTTITNDVTLNGAVNLSMTFAPGYVGSYELIQEGTVTGEGAFELSDNAIFNVTADAENNGTFNISLKDAGDIAQGTGADSNQAAAISALMRAAGGNETFASIATAIGNDLQSTDPALKQAALDAVTSMSPEVAPMVTQIQTDTAAQVFGIIGSRLGSSQGMASGDGTSGTGLWVQGMVGTTDMDDTSTARGYNADTTGFALGLEAKPSDSTKVGMGFAYTNTDVDGFLRSTDVDSYTAFLYGEYKPSNWFVNGIVSYAWANYDEQRNVLGQSISAKYDADTLGLQLMGGLDLDVSGFTVTPEAGLRYYHIGRDSYTDGMGSAVSDSDEDMLTGVVGARFAKTFEVSPSMTFVPEVRLAMTYDIVDADNTSFVTLANGSSYAVDGETLDRFGFEAGVGVKAEMGDNFELSLSYEGAWRGDYQNHAGILNAKYKF